MLLAGCSSAPAEPAATEDAEVLETSKNDEACKMFADLTLDLAKPFQDGAAPAAWDDLKAEFDTASIHASGNVKERLELLVDGWVPTFEMMLGDGMIEMNRLIENVGTACEVDGAKVDFAKFDAT